MKRWLKLHRQEELRLLKKVRAEFVASSFANCAAPHPAGEAAKL